MADSLLAVTCLHVPPLAHHIQEEIAVILVLKGSLRSKVCAERAAEIGCLMLLGDLDVNTRLPVRQYLSFPSPALPEPWVKDLQNPVHLPLKCRCWALECPALVLHHFQELWKYYCKGPLTMVEPIS